MIQKKQEGFLDFPIVSGCSFSPATLHVKATVTRFFANFPPFHDVDT
jgi:hypothetical protein